MLPKIEHPIYEIYLKSLDRKVKFRPFLVKEEKLLLMAKESKEADTVLKTIKQIIQNCLLEDISVETLPMFDVEMIFVKLRAKSVGESVKLSFNCKNTLENGEVCNGDTDYTLDLEKVKFEESEGHDPKIMITENLGFKLKYPTLNMSLDFAKDESEIEVLLTALLESVEYIFDKESMYKPESIPQNELNEFLDNLSVETLDKIQRFFATTPKVVLTDIVKCKKCGYEHTLRTENLLDFFI